MMAAGRGVIGLLTGDRQAGSYFDLSNRGLAGSFIALLLITALNGCCRLSSAVRATASRAAW